MNSQSSFRRAVITGIGSSLPQRVVRNADLEKLMDTSDEWIQERTGIRERRFADPGCGVTDLAVPAVEIALRRAQLSAGEIDLIIFATSTPDFYAPGSACLLQDRLGFRTIGALDIRAQCAGFIYGLATADCYIRAGNVERVLLVCAEVQSSGLDLSTGGRDTAVIFGDGCAAAVLCAAQGGDRGVLSTHLHSEGKYAKELWVEAPGSKPSPRISSQYLEQGRHLLKMNGSEVFRHALQRFPEAVAEALQANGLSSDDIALFIPHQANLRIIQAVQKRLELSSDKVAVNIDRYGNTTAASIPLALCEAVENGRVKTGDLLLCAAFGSGFSWGSAALRW